jgi:signal peptidase II
VIDFIDVHFKSFHWPTFNIADASICVGAALLAYDVFFSKNRLPKETATDNGQRTTDN